MEYSKNLNNFTTLMKKLCELRSKAHFDEDTEDYLLEKIDKAWLTLTKEERATATRIAAELNKN